MPRPSTTTVRDLRKNNRSRALWQVFLNGPLTRQEVGTVAGLSPATVSNLVAALVAEGVVAEVGLPDEGRGAVRVRVERDGLDMRSGLRGELPDGVDQPHGGLSAVDDGDATEQH